MKRPSISLPDWMVEQIEERREKGTNRSEYIRESLEARFDMEDSGDWETSPTDVDEAEQVAD